MINKERFMEWLDRVFDVPVRADNRCRELANQLPAYVEANNEGKGSMGEFGGLREHLDICPDCSELYAELSYLVNLEADGPLPDVATLLSELAGEEAAAPVL